MGGRNNQVAIGGQEQFYKIQVQLTAAAGETDSTTPAVPIGSFPFRWEELGADWDDTKGVWSIRISDVSQDKSFSADKVNVKAFVGVEKQAYELRHPWTFAGGSAISVEATNDGTDSDTLTLVFLGARLPAS